MEGLAIRVTKKRYEGSLSSISRGNSVNMAANRVLGLQDDLPEMIRIPKDRALDAFPAHGNTIVHDPGILELVRIPTDR